MSLFSNKRYNNSTITTKNITGTFGVSIFNVNNKVKTSMDTFNAQHEDVS